MWSRSSAGTGSGHTGASEQLDALDTVDITVLRPRGVRVDAAQRVTERVTLVEIGVLLTIAGLITICTVDGIPGGPLAGRGLGHCDQPARHAVTLIGADGGEAAGAVIPFTGRGF